MGGSESEVAGSSGVVVVMEDVVEEEMAPARIEMLIDELKVAGAALEVAGAAVEVAAASAGRSGEAGGSGVTGKGGARGGKSGPPGCVTEDQERANGRGRGAAGGRVSHSRGGETG